MTTVENSLVVSEVFGPTIQGEGRHAGQRAVFLRLGRCNLDCSWCDTPYTWDWKRYSPATELTVRSYPAVALELWELAKGQPAMLVITGGEPLLQADALNDFVNLHGAAFTSVGIETNGTRPPLEYVTSVAEHYTLSPKLATSGVDARKRRVHEAWLGDTQNVDWKFVVTGADGELAEILELTQRYEIPPDRVWLMAEGTSARAQVTALSRTMELAIASGFNYSPRLHTLAWGDRRAV